MHPLSSTPLEKVLPACNKCCSCLISCFDVKHSEEEREKAIEDIKLQSKKLAKIIQVKKGKYEGTKFGRDAKWAQGLTANSWEDEADRPVLTLGLGIKSYFALLWQLALGMLLFSAFALFLMGIYAF